MKPPSIDRVRIRNYRSFAGCDVRLSRLAFLVGPNGSGKSNFLDALRFVAESLETTPEHALSERGGLDEVCHRSASAAEGFGLALELTTREGRRGRYAFSIGGGSVVRREECVVEAGAEGGTKSHFRIASGEVLGTSLGVAPPAASDRLYLVHASGFPEFRPIYDALSHLRVYNLNPQVIRDLQNPNGSLQLARDGRNLAAVFERLSTEAPEVKVRIEEYLGKVVPGIRSVDVRSLGPKLTLEFRQAVSGSDRECSFLAANMSDGTLRALAILVALHPSARGHVALIGIEEPELAVHPAAAGVLLDSLIEASHRTQVLVTSHSPELLDDDKIEADIVLPVNFAEGKTWIGTLDEFGRSALRDRVATAGELLRLNQVTMDLSTFRGAEQDVRLFDED